MSCLIVVNECDGLRHYGVVDGGGNDVGLSLLWHQTKGHKAMMSTRQRKLFCTYACTENLQAKDELEEHARRKRHVLRRGRHKD